MLVQPRLRGWLNTSWKYVSCGLVQAPWGYHKLVNPERVSSEQAQLYNEATKGTFIALADTLNMHRIPSFSHRSVRWECDLNADTCNLHDGTYSPSA